MCWNATVSLNTFLFSSFVLLLIIYNNTYTKYKIHELNNVYIYIFFALFISIQLIEFFIWRNVNNQFYNNIFSITATMVLFLQPIVSIMIISSNDKLRNSLVLCYLLLAIPYSIYSFSTKHIHTVVGESGHLKWYFFDTNPIIWTTWMFFFLFSFFYEKKFGGFIFGMITLIITYINYQNDGTMWSMWCWVVNALMIYYAGYLLFYLPFIEERSVC